MKFGNLVCSNKPANPCFAKDDMTLPVGLLTAISNPGGGQVALVIGAGCSFEAPTSLPLAGKCSEDAHRKLVDNGVLADGECAVPWDLSALADLIKAKNGGQQAELVKCLPYNKFKTAKANEGHLIAAALLLEGAVTNIITLNYDLALSNALAALGVGDEVSIVNGPDQHSQMGKSNVIYLHRSVDNDFEEWILTTEALETEWQDNWEEVVARSMIAVPVTVFAGMGSSCGVLRHSTEKIRSAVGNDTRLILANPGNPADSNFADEIKIEGENYVQLGWIDFMRKLGERYHKETANNVDTKCHEIAKREGYIDPATGEALEEIDELTNRVRELGILGFGSFRSAILLDSRAFPKVEEGHLYSIAGLLLAVGCVERQGNASAVVQNDGHVVFNVDGKREVPVLLVDGSTKNLRWLTLESQLVQHEKTSSHDIGKKSRRVMAIGISGTKLEEATPPKSIVGDDDEHSILTAEDSFAFWDIEDLRSVDGSIESLLS